MPEIRNNSAEWKDQFLELQKALSRIQFVEIIKYGRPDYAKVLDLIVGILIFRTNPELYSEMITQFNLARSAARGQNVD